MSAHQLLVVIPARGGSKGIPGKNIKPLGDVPLLGWTADAICRSRGADRTTVILSTDDEEIARVGRDFFLDVPFLRPSDLSTDEAGSVDVAIHALDWLEQNRGLNFKAVMLLQPTSPFRSPEQIEEAIALMQRSDATAIVGVERLYRSMSMLYQCDDVGVLLPLTSGQDTRTRRQDIEPIYTPNGAMYLVCTAALRRERTFVPAGSRVQIMDRISGIDIDDQADWDIAEAIARAGQTWRGEIGERTTSPR